MQLYANQNDPEQVENTNKFRAFMDRNPSVSFYKPSPDKAPWHVQARFEADDGAPIVVNFWPHKAKSQRDGCHALEGWDAAQSVLDEAVADSLAEPFDVIEG